MRLPARVISKHKVAALRNVAKSLAGTPASKACRARPVLSLIAFVVIFILSTDDLIERMGNLTPWSFGLFAMTLVFAIAVLASLTSVLRAGGEVRRGVRCFSITVTAALVIAATYLACWGIIGLRTWA
jgi:hypothetical protein